MDPTGEQRGAIFSSTIVTLRTGTVGVRTCLMHGNRKWEDWHEHCTRSTVGSEACGKSVLHLNLNILRFMLCKW